MNVLLNTSFFFSPSVAGELRRQLKSFWIPACRDASGSEPMLLRMPAEDGVERLAVQTVFPSVMAARVLRDEVLAPKGGELTLRFGADSFTCFSTMMEIVDL